MRGTEVEANPLTERERKNVAILEAIKRYGPISRTDISKLTKLNIVTVSNYVNSFIEHGLVIEKGLDISSGGRRPTIVVLNPKASYVIGVDLGIFHIAAVLADLEGNVIGRSRAPRPRDTADNVVKVLTEQIEKVIKSSAVDPKRLRGVQVGASGVIDREVGTIRCTEGVASIYVPVTTLLSDRFKIPVKLEHDVTTAAYGEWSLGAGNDVDIMLFMYSGVGCGMIINGEIYHGATGTAGEVSIKDQLDQITLETVFEAVKEGDKLATEAVQKAGERLGVRVAFLINLLNPGAVVIGGGVEAAGPAFLEAVKKMVRMCAFEEMANAVKIVPARLGEDSVALGAASLVIRDVFASV
ncbi:MAG: ROK family transcriptional regulator [Candidatus Omnitrophica bacterium]|nr:ROK family transcriptional regulator [Candidatus Omnitrophota bacterium]